MILSGKCKEEFEKWLSNNHEYHIFCYKSFNFYTLPFAMQYGVLVDFFDSVGIYISDTFFDYSIAYNEGEQITDGHYAHRTETRAKAIKKANELFNEKFK